MSTNKALDKADYIEDENYILEVCSPGFLNPAQTEPDEDIVDQEETDNE